MTFFDQALYVLVSVTEFAQSKSASGLLFHVPSRSHKIHKRLASLVLTAVIVNNNIHELDLIFNLAETSNETNRKKKLRLSDRMTSLTTFASKQLPLGNLFRVFGEKVDCK